MQPITHLILALAVVASTVALIPNPCSSVQLGKSRFPLGIKIKNVTTTYLMTETDEKLYVPQIPQRPETWLIAVATACNLEGHAPFILKSSNVTADIHCTFQDRKRCPRGVEVEIVESYPDGPLVPKSE